MEVENTQINFEEKSDSENIETCEICKHDKDSHSPNCEQENENSTIVEVESEEKSQLIDLKLCRICQFQTSPNEILLSPCNCKGSIQFVHNDCLDLWCRTQNSEICEICLTEFKRIKKHIFRRFWFWFKNQLNLTTIAGACFIFVTILDIYRLYYAFRSISS